MLTGFQRMFLQDNAVAAQKILVERCKSFLLDKPNTEFVLAVNTSHEGRELGNELDYCKSAWPDTWYNWKQHQ
jgi:hypothetical protein